MFSSISPWPVVKDGSNAHPVKTLQYLLRAHGHRVGVDGVFGPTTETAVKAFQTSHGLLADGFVGPITWAALVVSVCLWPKNYALSLDIPSVTADGIVGPVTWQALVSGMLSF